MARVRLFAALRDMSGRSDDEIDASSVGELSAAAADRYGSEFERSLEFSRIAVNGIFVSELEGDATPVGPDDEVAFLPPVSGG